MAGPGGIDPQLQQQTSPTTNQMSQGVRAYAKQHQQSYLKSAAGGALNGFMLSGSPFGALIGAAGSMATQAIANKQNKKATEEAQKTARDNAAEAFAREQGSQREANEWNRESSQVSRFIEAGLSPGLMYGQMSDSSASAVSAPSAETVQPMASALQDPKLLEALGVYLQQLQTGSNVGLQGAQARNFDANTQGTQIDNQTRSQRNVQEIQTSIASMYSLLASAGKANAETDRIRRLIDLEYQQLEKALQVSDSQISLNQSATGLNNAKAGEVPSQIAANWASANQSNANADYIRGPQSSYTQQQEIESMARTENQQLQYRIGYNNYQVFYNWLSDHGIDPKYAGIVQKAAESAGVEFPKAGAQALESWLDGGNWLKFIMDWKRTNKWASQDPSHISTEKRKHEKKK